MANAYIDPQSSIIWIDSDPNIHYAVDLLRTEKWHVACFNETADALNALHEHWLEADNINCVITSMMERGGRPERGLLSGLGMLDKMKLIWEKDGIRSKPLIAVISLTANMQKCREHGVDIVSGNRKDLQLQVIERLKKNLNSTHCKNVILIGISGPSGCGKSTYAKNLADYLHSSFLPISLDNFFTSPIIIGHPISAA